MTFAKGLAERKGCGLQDGAEKHRFIFQSMWSEAKTTNSVQHTVMWLIRKKKKERVKDRSGYVKVVFVPLEEKSKCT